jgi:hypothetical protein
MLGPNQYQNCFAPVVTQTLLASRSVFISCSIVKTHPLVKFSSTLTSRLPKTDCEIKFLDQQGGTSSMESEGRTLKLGSGPCTSRVVDSSTLESKLNDEGIGNE